MSLCRIGEEQRTVGESQNFGQKNIMSTVIKGVALLWAYSILELV